MKLKPEEIQNRLTQQFPQSQIEVVDLTGTEDHYQVLVVSTAFQGLSRIQQHKKVMEPFATELKTGELHAFVIQTRLPQT